MENYGTINLVQPRVSNDQSATTRLYVYGVSGMPAGFDIKGSESATGFFDLVHPSIMAGTTDDFYEVAIREANNRLICISGWYESACGAPCKE